MEMEDELVKRYTDCVYFLASPLTCKKGIECEYRHSEIARLNPRDCWYWLAGCCLNPSCAFRHPPLDIHTKISEHAPSRDQHFTPTKKVDVPCYFYFSGFCKKGDKCCFLHVLNDPSKVLKTTPAVNDAPQIENKTSSGSNMVPVAIKTLPISSEAARKLSAESQVKSKEDVNPPDFKGQNDTPHISPFIFEDDPATRFGTLLDREGSIQGEFEMYTDQISEEQENVHLGEDDWLESPPGFDVLVGVRSHNMGYEDDEEYIVGFERDEDVVDDHFLGYGYGDHAEYAGTLNEQRRIDSCIELDGDIDEQGYPILRRISGYDDEKMYPNSIRERKFLPVRLPINDCRGVDLHSHLRNRRITDNRRLACVSARNNSCVKICRRHEKSRQYGRFKATNYSGQFRQSHSNISSQHYKETRQFKRPSYSSGISRRQVMRTRGTEEYSAFSGPKTLDQIKEEKRRGSGNGYSYRNSKGLSKKSEDFQGPKLLSEILKDKRKLHFDMDANNGIS